MAVKDCKYDEYFFSSAYEHMITLPPDLFPIYTNDYSFCIILRWIQNSFLKELRWLRVHQVIWE